MHPLLKSYFIRHLLCITLEYLDFYVMILISKDMISFLPEHIPQFILVTPHLKRDFYYMILLLNPSSVGMLSFRNPFFLGLYFQSLTLWMIPPLLYLVYFLFLLLHPLLYLLSLIHLFLHLFSLFLFHDLLLKSLLEVLNHLYGWLTMTYPQNLLNHTCNTLNFRFKNP